MNLEISWLGIMLFSRQEGTKMEKSSEFRKINMEPFLLACGSPTNIAQNA